jgi:hypothetical protein
LQAGPSVRLLPNSVSKSAKLIVPLRKPPYAGDQLFEA